MTNYDTIIDRWARKMMGNTTGLSLQLRSCNVFAEGDSLFSFGRHFEMARAIRDKRGTLTHYLINGDTYSVTTSRHQSATRDWLSRTGIPSVTIPHRALTAAGISDLGSVRIVEVTDDTWTTRTERYINEQPPGSVWRTETHGTEYGYVDADGNPKPDGASPWDYSMGTQVYKYVETKPGHPVEVLYTSGRTHWAKWDVIHDERGTVYQRTVSEHHLGESLITADVPYSTSRKCPTCGGFGRRPGIARQEMDGLMWHDSQWCHDCDSRGVRITRRTRRAYFLSAFDEQETRPSYFFCELPKGAKPLTVSEARQALKPEAVVIAEASGRKVLRQGDVFAVPTELSTRDLRKLGATITKGAFILAVNHRATEVAVTTDGLTFIRGTITHDPGQWRRPDHKRVTVGKAWHVAVKNTVPLSR